MGSAQASGETIGGWRSNGSGAEWQNFRLVPGRYHLEFEANMSDAPVAGSIYASSKFQPQQSAASEFNEVTLLGNASENRRTFEIARSTDETTFTTTRVGPLTFARSPVTLRFTSTAGYPANIIRLRNFRLAPITEEAAASVPAPTPTANVSATLQQATAQLRGSLESVRKTATNTYLADLQKLAAGKPALKDQAEAESRRIRRLSDQKSGPTGVRAIATAAGGLNGFEDISDARLADAEPVSGDRFKVVHEGRELSIRLLWVKCAPVEEKDPGVKRFAKHFNIAEEDALDIGRDAREFTAGYLRDKPLRLLIRPDRDKDGTLAALLFLPEVGLYQNVLVDHGFAAVVPPPRETRRNTTEQALIATLSSRENAAKNRQPPPGAWALATESNGGKKQ
jgi:endonuclease YncB( thermonuclease family)